MNFDDRLHESCKRGYVEEVKNLLAAGVNPGCQDEGGNTPLILACYRGRIEIVQFLLNTGLSRPECEDSDGWTALTQAAYLGYLKIVKLLLDDGKVDPAHQNKRGMTALMYAAEQGHFEVVEMLLNSGKSGPELKDNGGHMASYLGDSQISKLIKSYKPIEAKYARKKI